MLGDNSRADDDQERKRYKSPPPPVAADLQDDDEDDIEDEVVAEEKEEEVKISPEKEMKVPKLVHSVSSFFLVKNQENDAKECPSSPKKAKSNTPLAETMIKTELEIKHQGRSELFKDFTRLIY